MKRQGVRVRGIYSTAIVQLLLDNNIPIADLSLVLKERFNIRNEQENIPVVTIKDTNDKKGFIIYGDPELSDKVLYVLKENVSDIVTIRSLFNKYSTILVKVLEKTSKGYIVELPGKRKGLLETERRHNIGDKIIAYVVSGVNRIILYEGIAIVGKFVRLIEHEKNKFSKHIKNPEKKTLLLSMLTNIEKPPHIGIYFRSSCNIASLTDILDEIQRLISHYVSLKIKAREENEISQVTQGEALYINFLPFETKNKFDLFRRKRISTLNFHHYIKSTNTQEKECLDLLEFVSSDTSSKKLIDYHVENILRRIKGKDIKFIHQWPSLDHYTYTCSVYKISYPLIYCRRYVSKEGIYDGLKIDKKPGDIIVTLFALFSPVIIHTYMRDNKVLGSYININSPMEVLNPAEFWYIDYHIDIIKKNGLVYEIDSTKLEESYKNNILTKNLYERILSFSKNIKEMLEKNIEKEKIILSTLPKKIYKK